MPGAPPEGGQVDGASARVRILNKGDPGFLAATPECELGAWLSKRQDNDGVATSVRTDEEVDQHVAQSSGIDRELCSPR